MFLQGGAEWVGGVDDALVPRGDSCHHDVPELMVVAVRHRRGEEQLRPAEVHMVAVGHWARLRIRLELADERARTLPLTPVDMELAVLQESELAAEDRRSRGVVMVVVVVAHSEYVRLLRGLPDDLPQFLLARALGRMRGEVVAVRAKSDARVQEDGDVRRLDERRHGSRAEAVRREGRNLHRITARPHIYRETTDRISPAMALASVAGFAASQMARPTMTASAPAAIASEAFPPWAPTPGARVCFRPMMARSALTRSARVAGAMIPVAFARVARRARSSACFAVYSTPPGWLISTTTKTSFPPAASTHARTESSPTKPWQMIPDAPASTACSTMSRFVFGMSAILKSHRT